MPWLIAWPYREHFYTDGQYWPVFSEWGNFASKLLVPLKTLVSRHQFEAAAMQANIRHSRPSHRIKPHRQHHRVHRLTPSKPSGEASFASPSTTFQHCQPCVCWCNLLSPEKCADTYRLWLVGRTLLPFKSSYHATGASQRRLGARHKGVEQRRRRSFLF